MLRPAFVLLFVVGILVRVQAQELHFWAEELRPIFEVLQQADLSGSVELDGRCDPARLPGFPQFGSAAPTKRPPLATLRDIAANDPAMQVRQDPDGTIRMREKGVPTDILNVRISHISFEDYARHDIYTANLALRVILSAPEVLAYAKMHNIALGRSLGAGIGAVGMGYSQWPPGSPHISGSLDDVTVLEALNRVLRAFPGEVFVYWNCPETHKKREQNQTKNYDKQQEESNSSSDCPQSPGDAQSSVFPAGLPNPLCMPRSAQPRLPHLFLALAEPSHERTIFLWFFSMRRGFGGKMLVGSG
jgi:hypothetical protein